MSNNPRHPSHLNTTPTADTVASMLGEGAHQTWILKKLNATKDDYFTLNLQEDFALIWYVNDAKGTLHVYVKTYMKVTPQEMVYRFNGFRIKVASSPCDYCKLNQMGHLQLARFPEDPEIESDLELDDFFNTM